MAYRPPVKPASPEQRGQQALQGQTGPAGTTPHIERVRGTLNGSSQLAWTYAETFATQPRVTASGEGAEPVVVWVVSHTMVGPDYTGALLQGALLDEVTIGADKASLAISAAGSVISAIAVEAE